MVIEMADKSEPCVECDRLFEQYTGLIHAHLEAISRSRSAAEEQDRIALSESERLENFALHQRQALRLTIMEHEVNHLVGDRRNLNPPLPRKDRGACP